MKLGALAKDSRVLLDANVVVYAAHGVSGQCMELVKRCAAGELKLFMPLHALSEACHRIMISEARELGLTLTGNPAKKLATNPGLVRRLKSHSEHFELMRAWGVIFEAAREADFSSAFRFQSEYGLLMNDALMAAIASRLGIRAIATADSAFRRIKEFEIYSPQDLK